MAEINLTFRSIAVSIMNSDEKEFIKEAVRNFFERDFPK